MKKKFQLIPDVMWPPVILTLILNVIAYNGSRIFNQSSFHYDLSNSIDDKLPLLPWTIIIYLGCYVFWISNYIIGCRQEPKKAFDFISADIIARFVCLLCFLFLPTTLVRPEVQGTSIWDNAIRWLYQTDPSDNLFPSIHCMTSWFAFIAVRTNKKIPTWYKITSLFLALSVFISTLTTKQHVIIDVFAGTILAEASYFFVKISGFSKWYSNIMTNLCSSLLRHTQKQNGTMSEDTERLESPVDSAESKPSIK